MHGKTVVLTGGTSGFGQVVARDLARLGAKVGVAGRSRERLEAAREIIQAASTGAEIDLCEMDLSSQRSVAAGARHLVASLDRLDVLVNNAGTWSPQRQRSADGFELVFATNVLGAHLLTHLLRPVLEAAAPARIVNVASDFAGDLELDDLHFRRRKYVATKSYRQSKQANRMLTRAWARELGAAEVTVNAVTPGMVLGTGLYRGLSGPVRLLLSGINLLVGRTIEEGADTITWLASSPEVEGKTGLLWDGRAPKACAFDDRVAEDRLWSACEGLLLRDLA